MVALLLMTIPCFAQGARNASYLTSGMESVSNFTYLGAMGMDTTGNPGFIKLRSATARNSSTVPNETYFLWVGSEGQLCLASYTNISNYSSFPSGDWSTDVGCVVVGGQAD